MNKFYQLQPDEWLSVCKELKPAELKVLYRLRTLDPFGQHPIKFRVVDLAKDLDMNKGTVSRAVQRLADLGYINLEIIEAIATLTTKSKKLCTDNLVVSTQQNLDNTRLCTDNPVVSTQLGCVQTTSAIATQPDNPQSGSGQGTDFSKISLEDLRRSDLDRDFENSKNSALCAQPKSDFESMIYSCTDEAAQKCDLKVVKQVEYTNTPEQPLNPVEGDSFRRRVEDFILKSLQIAPRDRQAYFSKFTNAHWQEWEARYKATLAPPSPTFKPFVPEVVEVAPPDVAIANIQKIKEMLARGAK